VNKTFQTIGLVLMMALLLSACARKTTTGQLPPASFPRESVTLEYWRLFDDSAVFDEFITDYKEAHPNINIVVKKMELGEGETIYDYQQRVTKAIADGQGPDIFMIHNDWLPYHINQISPLPQNIINLDEYRRVFPEVVQNDFVQKNQIYAVPYYIDNLILFYNPRLLEEAGLKRLPQTWQEIVDLIPKLTKLDPRNPRRILQSAIPLGVTDTHISAFADILATLMMQNGAEMVSPDRERATFDLPLPGTPSRFPGKEALDFYTSFANPTKTVYTYTDTIKGSPPPTNWRALLLNEQKELQKQYDFPADIQAFIESKAAFFIGYSYKVKEIKRFAPNLVFNTTKLPQASLDSPKVIANYWGETVSRNSKYPDVAWDFVRFMATARNNSRYAQSSHRVPARKDLQESYWDKTYYGAVAQQISYSKSWYRQNTTKIESVFADMVRKVLHERVDTQTAVRAAAEAINDLK